MCSILPHGADRPGIEDKGHKYGDTITPEVLEE